MSPSGGNHPPAKPAAVSGPGALSARTDGGPGSDKQPIRVPTGGAYGEAQSAQAQQEAAPMAAGGPGPDGRAPSTGPPPVDVFGPTQMPNQPITAGIHDPQQALPDAKFVLQKIYEKYPSPWIAMLMNGR